MLSLAETHRTGAKHGRLPSAGRIGLSRLGWRLPQVPDNWWSTTSLNLRHRALSQQMNTIVWKNHPPSLVGQQLRCRSGLRLLTGNLPSMRFTFFG